MKLPEKKLGFGCMRFPLLNPDDPTTVDVPQVCDMVDAFLEKGFTYFDTAWFYHKGLSENIVKEALVDRYPRDKFTVATKLPLSSLKEADEARQEEIFATQLQKIGVEYFDYYLLHNINTDNYQTAQRLHSFDFVSRMKAEGKVKHMGFSFHDKADVLDKVLTEHPEVEFVQLQLNYLDWESSTVQSRLCYEVAVKHGKKVVVMEPVKGGKLAVPQAEVVDLFKSYAPDASPASWAIRFAATLPEVMVVLSGMSNREQMADNAGYMEHFQPLNEEEQAIVEKAADIIRGDGTVPCTGCAYCVDGCPQGIPIPEHFAILNNSVRNPGPDYRAMYQELAAEKAPASNCVFCGQCMGACPQHIDVIGTLMGIAEKFEK